MTSDEFLKSRSVLESQRKELKQMGKGYKPNKAETITTDQVEQLWEKGELGNRDAKHNIFLHNPALWFPWQSRK